MLIRPPDRSRANPRRRTLNVEGIKTVIVAVAAAVTAVGSALTGVGAQVGFTPMLVWMLGVPLDRAHATAMRFGLFAAGSAVFGALLRVDGGGLQHFSMAATVKILISSVVLFVGATVGASLTASLLTTRTVGSSERLQTPAIRRFFSTLAIGFAFFVLIQARLITPFNTGHVAHWRTVGALAALGVTVGALTQLFGLVSGALMVPALYFLCGLNAQGSILVSLVVIVLASLLPSWAYWQKGLVLPGFGGASVVGGIAGGLLGGMILMHCGDRTLLILFAGITMFFPARELARMAASATEGPSARL